MRVLSEALGEFDAKPELRIDALQNYLGPGGVRALLTLLAKRADSAAPMPTAEMVDSGAPMPA